MVKVKSVRQAGVVRRAKAPRIRMGPWRRRELAAGVLSALVLALVGDVLLTSEPTVLSMNGTDISAEYLHARQFGFQQLIRGNLALWNPHIYGGAPFFGNFQSALLYPPNVIYLLAPLARAINVSIVLHVLLLGAGMVAWGRWRGLSMPAAMLAGVLGMLGAAHWMHVVAGHLSNLCTMAWAPLLLLTVDACFDRPSAPWGLLGAGIVAMMVLAGHPQYVFFTGVAVGIYTVSRLFVQVWGCRGGSGKATGGAPGSRALPGRAGIPCAPASAACPARPSIVRTIALLLLTVAGGLALSGVQLMTGLAAARDSVRAGGLHVETAQMFSFPPENFLTLIAPQVFGDDEVVVYWGRWYRWEVTIFIGVGGLVLAACGMIWGRLKARPALLATLGLVLLIALGMYTPLFDLLYHHVSGFDRIRGWCKFIFHGSLLLALLAGAGLDALRTRRRGWWAPAAVAVALGVAALLAAGRVRAMGVAADLMPWREVVTSLNVGQAGDVRQVYLPIGAYNDPRYLRHAARLSADSLALGGALLLASAVPLALCRRWPSAAYALALMAGIEVSVFVAQTRPTFSAGQVGVGHSIGLRPGGPGDYRILNRACPNEAMGAGVHDVWGAGPEVRQRYAEFMFFAQNEPLEDVSQDGRFANWDRVGLFALARLKYRLILGRTGPEFVPVEAPMDRLNLVGHWQVLPGRDDIFQAMLAPDFDPRRTVLLEQSPGLPEPSAPASAAATAPAAGTVKLVESSTDHLVVEADVPAPTVLLITDAYDPPWQAEALPGSSQSSYTLMPGNYAFQAVPLSAGHHLLRIVYRPAAFGAGLIVSLTALACYANAWIFWYLIRSRPKDKPVAAA